MNPDPRTTYQQLLQVHRAELARLQQRHSRLGWWRLALVLGTAIGAYQVFTLAGAWAWLVVLAGTAMFLRVIGLDADNGRELSRQQSLVRINETELRVLDLDLTGIDGGADLQPTDHAYAYDLDLLGPFSVFQWLNRCSSEQGRALLAAGLLAPLPSEVALARQEAASELAPQLKWRQQLQAASAQQHLTVATEHRLQRWLAGAAPPFQQQAWRWIVPAYSLITCGVALAAIMGWMSTSLFTTCFIFFLLVSATLGRKAMAAGQQLSGIVAELDTLQQVLQVLEAGKWNSPLNVSLQQQLGAGGAAAGIAGLKAILNRFDLRLNVFLFILLNSFLLWDVRQLQALGKWRRRHKGAATGWFAVVAQFEVLASLATLRFNHPGWAQPRFVPGYCTLEAAGLGHPLIRGEQRVVSDFGLQGSGQVALITGSNMAGKSTFLRSLGINVVLAQMGAVVCARTMVLTPVQLMSSMRIADNLAESTSTFYAELKKLKAIIDAVKQGQPVLVLLDEILRGTNSLDRHTGSRALIGQLLRANSVAILATHDVELAQLETTYPGRLHNYHFDVQVAGQELYFDYLLKKGICTNLNASVLMQKIGIEL